MIAEVGLRLLSLGGETFRDTALETPHRSRPSKPDRRNRRWSGKKEAGRFRIVAAGDSFTWGAGVHPEDAYPDRLEDRLNTLDRLQRFEVVNFSRPGWNTIQAYRAVKRKLRRLEPDLLIVGYVLNDAEPSESQDRARRREVLHRRQPSARASAWLHRHSLLYRTIWERLESTRQRRAFTAVLSSDYEGYGWYAGRRGLALFEELADQLGIPFLLVVFPVFDSQIDENYPYHEIHDLVAETAAGLGIRVLDLREVYRGVDARRLAITPFTDAHPDELAHRLAADALLDYLVEEELVPLALGRK